jgi:predicted DNA-binding protein
VPVIRQRKRAKRKIARSFRFKPEILEKISEISEELGEDKTYVLENLLEYAIEAYEEEKKKKKKK